MEKALQPEPRSQARTRLSDEDVEGQILLLMSPDYKVRTEACRVLGNSRNPQAVEPLIAALHDPTATVRQTACIALGKLGERQRGNDPRITEALLSALTDRNHHTHAAAYRWLLKQASMDVLAATQAFAERSDLSDPVRRYVRRLVNDMVRALS